MDALRSLTSARVALSRSGHAVSTTEVLAFQLDHARARDAIYSEMDSLPLPHIEVRSGAADRAEYLRRPDLGRRLSETSRAKLAPGAYDAAIVVADGLSALAVNRHAVPLLEELLARLDGWTLAPLVAVRQGRVAIADEIGDLLDAKLALILIGERPGLSSPDSLGAYLTWNPRVGRTDAERNCISNIRVEGLSYAMAAHRLAFLMNESRRRCLSGVALKEEAGELPDLLAPGSRTPL